MTLSFTIPPSFALDVAALRKDGFFAPDTGRWWRQQWKHGDLVVLDLRYRLVEAQGKPCAIRVKYFAKGDDFEYPISFEYTDCHFGGSRPWLVCPIRHSGKCCKRARILYFPLNGMLFGCRNCLGLSYVSQEFAKSPVYQAVLKPFRVASQLQTDALHARSERSLLRYFSDLKAHGELGDETGAK